jgi:hypothetical protein
MSKAETMPFTKFDTRAIPARSISPGDHSNPKSRMLSFCDMTAPAVVCSVGSLIPAPVARFRRPSGVNWQLRKLRIDLQSPVVRSGKALREWQEYC